MAVNFGLHQSKSHCCESHQITTKDRNAHPSLAAVIVNPSPFIKSYYTIIYMHC